MDAKSGPPPSSNDEEPAPPSYNDALSTPYNSSYNPSSSTSQYYSQQIQSQLHTLTTQITSLKTQKSLLSNAQDEKILSLLTTQIQLYLSAFAKTGLQRGTLILVPAKSLEEENALPVEYEDRREDGIIEYDQLVRIKDAKNEGGYEDEDGETWFWRDEDMAMRLAGYLQPAPDLKNAPLPPRREEVKATEPSSSRGFWGRKKSAKSVERPSLVEDKKAEPVALPSEIGQDKVVMTVKAEEVDFRTENDFGIFETRRGWAIVLKLAIVERNK